MSRLIRYLRGSVRFRLTGAAPEQCLNALAAARLEFWDIEREDALHLSLCVPAREAERLQGLALRCLCTAEVTERSGLRAQFGGLLRRPVLLLGLLAMKALDTSQTPEGMPALKGILGAAACFLAAALLHCDYDVLGLALILALYMTRKDKRAQCIAGAVFSLFEPVAPLAFGLVWFYSGERGGSSKLEQWAFYWFYPAHIFVLGILTNLLLFR